jgi:hypothetical protein
MVANALLLSMIGILSGHKSMRMKYVIEIASGRFAQGLETRRGRRPKSCDTPFTLSVNSGIAMVAYTYMAASFCIRLIYLMGKL